MNTLWEIQTYRWSLPKSTIEGYQVDEIISGTYYIKRETLEQAIEVLRRKTPDAIKSAQKLYREILY